MNSRLFNRFWPFLKWGMFVAIVVFVARHGWKLWTEVDQHPLRLKWGWLALAAVASAAAWLPSAWYWRRLMSDFGFSPRWPQVLRAHYCGQLGKYTPGKAAALLIRVALIRDEGVPATAAALAVTVETVTYMWAGTILAILLYPWLVSHFPARLAEVMGEPWWRGAALVLVVGGGLKGMGLLLKGYHRLNDLFRQTSEEATPTATDRSPIPTTAIGVIVFLAAWWIQGLTLGLTIQAVSAEPVNWSDWPFWTGAAAVAVVGGFVAIFSPGGLGVREGLLMELLSRQLGPHEAVAVAMLLRGVMLAGEILVAGGLYYAVAGGGRLTEPEGPANSR